MREIKEIKATGEYVVLQMVVKEEGSEMFKKNKSGILLPNSDEVGQTANTGNGKLQLEHAVVHDIGPGVENPSFKKGDKVVFNDYDIKYVGSKENMFGITKATGVMAVYEPGEEIEE